MILALIALTRPTSESEITLERIRKVLATGANVVLTTKGIDDLALKEFVEAGAMAVRRCRKEDLRRIAKATGGQLVSSLANLDGEETFETSYLGIAEEVVQERISDDELILVKGTKVVNAASIILRGANDYMLDEMERGLHDTLSVIKRTLESGSVVPGGGAVESALSIYLENFATTLVRSSHVALIVFVHHIRTQGSREQLAIAEFASALLIIPKTLAVNAAKDATDLVAKLRSYHNTAQNAPAGDAKKVLLRYGLDLLKGDVRDNVTAGVLEPTVSKVRSLKSAFEAAVSLLRIDDAIQVVPGEYLFFSLLTVFKLTTTRQSNNRSVMVMDISSSLMCCTRMKVTLTRRSHDVLWLDEFALLWCLCLACSVGPRLVSSWRHPRLRLSLHFPKTIRAILCLCAASCTQLKPYAVTTIRVPSDLPAIPV